MVSLSKNKNKLIRSLSQKKYRDREGLFVVEGDKIVEEVLRNHRDSIDCIVSTHELHYNGIDCFLVSDQEMKQLTAFKTPSKILAVVRKPIFENQLDGLVVVLDDIQDPGNLGTIIRTSEWFGVKTIVCSKNTVDCFNPKVIQSSMGAIFRINIRYENLVEILPTKKHVYGALLEGNSIYNTELNEDSFLIIGNEGNGISEEIKAFITTPVKIPQFGSSESLNAAIACGIFLSHFRA